MGRRGLIAKLMLRARWVVALAAAAAAYVIVTLALPALEKGVPGISPTVQALNISLLATAAGLIAGSFTAPREHLRLARRSFFWLGLLTPLGCGVYEFFTAHMMTHDYLAMLGGAFAGGMLGLFVMILPKGARAPQPRRFS